MKKNLLKFLLIFMIIPVIMFSGCSKQLPAINLSRYVSSSISVTNSSFETKTANISLITGKKHDDSHFSNYASFEIQANPIWMYKMYVESITFYVYTSTSCSSQMVVNVSMTNLTSEAELKQNNSENPTLSTANEQCSFKPIKNKAHKCTFKIDKTVSMATGSTITIDINNSLDIYSEKPNFKWQIYGFEIHGESRSYSK